MCLWRFSVLRENVDMRCCVCRNVGSAGHGEVRSQRSSGSQLRSNPIHHILMDREYLSQVILGVAHEGSGPLIHIHVVGCNTFKVHIIF